MHPSEFEAEARALARPCVYLSTRGAEYAAVWGGTPVAPAPSGRFRHWLSVDVRYLPTRPWSSEGVISVFTNEADRHSGAVVFAPGATLPRGGSGLPLFATEGISPPPLEAVFTFGSPVVQEWLRSLGWELGWGYNDGFPARDVVDRYDRDYQDRLPFYTGTAHAVLGGWHLPWPDGDWACLAQATLLVWTFADSEPWVEAWSDGARQWVIERIT